MSLLATLGTRRCRDNGEVERSGGLEEVETGVGVVEIDGGLKWSPFWEKDGTLGLAAATNLLLGKIGDESCESGDAGDELSAIRWFETDARRGR